jgi:hypothetical protein
MRRGEVEVSTIGIGIFASYTALAMMSGRGNDFRILSRRQVFILASVCGVVIRLAIALAWFLMLGLRGIVFSAPVSVI